jgi:hypothetical protein
MNISNLGLQNQAAQIAAAQAQMAAGQQQQQTEQAGKTALYNQFLQQQGYPFQIAQFLANIAMGTGALSGSTTNATRTGQRGGRMGDGYASGGLVPDSQGGAVYEPGMYGRGGYADGGNTTSANPNDYDSLIRNAYGQIGRKDIGTTANTIDQDGYDYWMNKLKSGQISPDKFYSEFTAGAQAYNAANSTSDIAKLTQPNLKSDADYRSVSGLNPDIADAFKEAVGKDIDAASARKYQDMLNAGMSLDQIKYNIVNSQPAKLKAGDVDALKGTPLTYDAGKFSQAVMPVQNQYGAFSAGDFTPSNMTYGQRPGYGNMSAMRGGYGGYGQPIGGTYGDAMPLGGFGGYGGGLGGYGGGFGGYGQPSNYGMPNFGSSQQYGGAPDYAGAMQYGGMRAQYGMPQGYGMPPQMGGYNQYAQQAPQATGKGAAPSQQQAQYYNAPGSGGRGINPDLTSYQQQAPQATGKGASSPQPASGKGASSMAGGGRAAFASGGRAGYAQGGNPMSGIPVPGDPYGALQAQAAMFANAPGAAMGYVPPSQGGAGQYKMLQPQASILPQQQSGIKEAAATGASIASLGEAGSKLYDKLSKPSDAVKGDKLGLSGTTSAPMGGAAVSLTPSGSGAGAAKIDLRAEDLPVDAPVLAGMPAAAGKGVGTFAANGGRIGLARGGIPGLDDLKQGYAGIPGNEGTDTPMSQVIAGGTKTPTELKAEMDRMSSGSGGMGGSGGGMGSALGTAASVASLGSMAFKVGGWMMGLPIFAAGGRVGKAGGGSLVDPSNPRDQAMAESFDNLLQRYDNNPLLAAAAMDVGTKVVDAAIQKAQQTGGDITDFLPRRTQEYMFALSKAAMGAHEAINRPARAAGGRTGYALPGFVDDEPAGLAPSSAMTMEDVAGGLSPEPTVQVAELKNPDILRALRGVEGANNNPEAKNPNSTAGGLYQYIDSTWQKQAPLAGVDIKQYPTARSAPAEIQHQVADANVSSILEQNKGNVQAVPHLWYSGNLEGKMSPEGLAANKGFTQEQYNQRFFNKLGAGAPESKPVQVATATGLAPKTDAGPFETIGKKILPDAVPTDSSFWVPLIAGLGTMLASDKYRFSQRLGEGLVGGAAAFGKQQEFGLQKEKVDIERQNNALTMFGKLFQPQYNKNGQLEYLNVRTGEIVSPEEATRLMFGATGTAYPAIQQAIATAKGAPTAAGTTGIPVSGATTEAPKVSTVPPTGTNVIATSPKPEIEESKTIPKPEEFKSFEDVDNWARAQTRVVALQQRADAEAKKLDSYQQALDNLPSNPLSAARRAELTSLITASKQAEQSYRTNADKAATDLATPYKNKLAEEFKVSPGMIEAKAKGVTAETAAKLTPEIVEREADAEAKKKYASLQSESSSKLRDEAGRFFSHIEDRKALNDQLINIYTKFDMNRLSTQKADAIGYLISIPVIGDYVKSKLGDLQNATDASVKAAITDAFKVVNDENMGKAPRTGMIEALQTVPGPDLGSGARYILITKDQATLDRSADRFDAWIAAGSPVDHVKFMRNWDKEDGHAFNDYLKKSVAKTPYFAGMDEKDKKVLPFTREDLARETLNERRRRQGEAP